MIDAAFGAVIDRPKVNRLVDELVAYSYRDDGTRDALAEFYRSATDQLATELQRAWGPACRPRPAPRQPRSSPSPTPPEPSATSD